MDAKSKLKVLQEVHGIPMTEEIEEEVRNMCTYTASVLAQGEVRGEARGEEKLAKLIRILVAEKKYDEISMATENRSVRNELYLKYGITAESGADI